MVSFLLILLLACAPGAQPLRAYQPPDLHSLAVTADPRVLYFGAHVGMLRSDDAGRTWSRVPIVTGDAMGHAAAGTRRIVAGHDVYYESDDGGATWRPARPALPGTDVHAIAVDPRDGTFYAFVVGFGLFRSADARTWTPVLGGIPESTIAMAVARVGDSTRLFAAGTHGVVVSDDMGRAWTQATGLGPTPSLAVVASAPSTLYAASLGKVYRSSDGGRAWAALTGAPSGAFLVAASADGQWVYVVTSAKEVWRSEDGGTTWRRADA